MESGPSWWLPSWHYGACTQCPHQDFGLFLLTGQLVVFCTMWEEGGLVSSVMCMCFWWHWVCNLLVLSVHRNVNLRSFTGFKNLCKSCLMKNGWSLHWDKWKRYASCILRCATFYLFTQIISILLCITSILVSCQQCSQPYQPVLLSKWHHYSFGQKLSLAHSDLSEFATLYAESSWNCGQWVFVSCYSPKDLCVGQLSYYRMQLKIIILGLTISAKNKIKILQFVCNRRLYTFLSVSNQYTAIVKRHLVSILRMYEVVHTSSLKKDILLSATMKYFAKYILIF